MEKNVEEVVEEVVSPQTSNLEQLIEKYSIVSEVQLSTRFAVDLYKGRDQEYGIEFGEQYGESDRLLEIVIGYENGDCRWTGIVIHDNINDFFQGLERELEVLDTLDDDQAIIAILKESMTKLAKPNLILNVEGGVVHDALSSLPVNLVVLDGDTEGFETDEIKTIEGDEYFVNPVEVRDDVEGVTNLVNLIHEAQAKSEM